MGCLSDVMPAEQSHDPRSWAVVTVHLHCPQQAPKTWDSLPHAREAQRLPERGLITTEDRLFEVLFKRFEDRHGRKPGPAQKHRLGIGCIRLPRQLIGALF